MIKLQTSSIARNTTLSMAVAGLFLLGTGSQVMAQDYPDKPLTMVVPASTGGSNDRAARAIAPFLSEELGQPVTIVNRPGGGNMLGHQYLLQQPHDGYTLMRTSAIPYMTINQLVQGAEFTIEDFQPINIVDIDTSIIATSNDSPYETIEDVITAIRGGTQLSVGVQPTSADMINLSLFLEALELSPDDVRIVTYDSGGPVRNGIIGGQFDIGVVGEGGLRPQRGEFRPLMSFTEEPFDVWDAPYVLEVLEAEGVNVEEDYPHVLSGSMRGYFVSSQMAEEYPERFERLVEAFENVSNNPEAIQAHEEQRLDIEWRGPERGREMMMNAHESLSNPEFLEIVNPN